MGSPERYSLPERQEDKEKPNYSLDLVVVPGARIHMRNGIFVPTGYEHSDGNGMLGGHLRVDAAVCLYLQKITKNFLFTGGRTPLVGNFDESSVSGEIPSEASVYKNYFLEQLDSLRNSSTFLTPLFEEVETVNAESEDDSLTTYDSLVTLIQRIEATKEAQKIGLLTNKYHWPRVGFLTQKAATDSRASTKVALFLLDAEDILMRSFQGVYDTMIANAYDSDLGRQRIDNETKGLEALSEERYDFTGGERLF